MGRPKRLSVQRSGAGWKQMQSCAIVLQEREKDEVEGSKIQQSELEWWKRKYIGSPQVCCEERKKRMRVDLVGK